MAQVKVYGLAEYLDPIKSELSNVIHSCVVEALHFPEDKRAHRFFPMAAENFSWPGSATARYTIIEIGLMEGRTIETKKRLIVLLFERICARLPREPHEIEMSVIETPKHDWGFRGVTGDEIRLPYAVDV